MGPIAWEILRDRNKAKVEEFLNQGGDLHHPDNGDSPTQLLCFLCRDSKSPEEFALYLDFFAFMIDKGFSPNEGIHIICDTYFRGAVAVPLLNLFVSKQGDVNYLDQGRSWTPLQMAVARKSDKLVEALLGHGAIPHARDLFVPASQSSLLDYEKIKFCKILDLYKKFELNLDAYDPVYHKTLLGIALCNHEDFMVSWLLEQGVDPNKPIELNGKNETPLMELAKYGHAHKNVAHYANLLLNKGADIDKKDRFGQTAMDYAVHYHNEQLIEALNEAKNKNTATAARLSFKAPPAAPEIMDKSFNENKLFFPDFK